jgi:flagellar biosynthetic protein FlhB
VAEGGDNSQEKELEPSERRILRAREQGQLPQSRDLATFAALVVVVIFLSAVGPLLLKQMVLMTQAIFQFSEPAKLMDHMQEWLGGSLLVVLLILALIFIPLWIVGVLAPLSLVNFQAYFAPQFNMGRLDIIAGLGRIFSLNALSELLKNLIKTTLMLAVGMSYLVGLFSYIRTLVNQGFDAVIDAAQTNAELFRNFPLADLRVLLDKTHQAKIHVLVDLVSLGAQRKVEYRGSVGGGHESCPSCWGPCLYRASPEHRKMPIFWDDFGQATAVPIGDWHAWCSSLNTPLYP